MADNKTPSKPENKKSTVVTSTGKPAATEPTGDAAKTAAPANGATNGATADKPKKAPKAKRERVRLVSASNPAHWCRMFRDVLTKYGAPYDSAGNVMVEQKAPVGGAGPKQPSAGKAERLAAKAAEEAKVAAMSDEEKVAYARAKREERAAEKAKKEGAERDALIAKIKADILAGVL